MREAGARLRCSCAKSLSLLCEGHTRTHASVARSRSSSSLSTSPPRPSLSLPTATDSWSRRLLVRGEKKCLVSRLFLFMRSTLALFFFGERAYPPPFVLFCRCILHTRGIDKCLTTCRSQLLVYALLVFATLSH
jgi:hypothetical protein